MSRELDWRIHELRGNDLTGFAWCRLGGDSAVKVMDNAVIWCDIPRYSSTGEGMLQLMEWLESKNISHAVAYQTIFLNYYAQVNGKPVTDKPAPLALAKAVVEALGVPNG